MNSSPSTLPGLLAKITLTAALITSTILLAAEEEDVQNRGQLSAADYKFAVAAARGGMLEVNLGKLASQKALRPAIRQFGRRMIDDHGKAGKQLEEIVTHNGATLPLGPT